MIGKVTPELGILYIKLGSWLLFTWPPNVKATRMAKIRFQVGWWISFIIIAHSVLASLGTAWRRRNNVSVLIELLSGAIVMVHVGLIMIITKVYHHQLQNIMERMEMFVKLAVSSEREILMNYVERITPPQLVYTAVAIFAALFHVLSPLVNGRPFPSRAEYPFPTDKHPTYDIIFLIQSIMTLQGCAGTFFNCQITIVIWYGTIQLDILAEKMRNVRSYEKLRECISMHQHLLKNIDRILETVKPLVVTVIIVPTIGILCWGIPILGNASTVTKIQSGLIACACSCQLFFLAWTADRLTTAYEEVGWALYSSPWIQASKEFKRTALFVMHRCQRPPVISFGGIMPKLSMSYYASYMAATYSYFTTIHAALK